MKKVVVFGAGMVAGAGAAAAAGGAASARVSPPLMQADSAVVLRARARTVARCMDGLLSGLCWIFRQGG